MGLDTPSGGHTSHGYYTPYGKKVSGASIFFESLSYKVDPVSGIVDYEKLEERVVDFRPKILICGGSSYPRDWDYGKFRQIADKCGAVLMCDMAQISGLIAAKHMLPLLKVGGGNGTERDVAVVANISARVGSIGDNRLGGWHSYRSSKTALNQCMKNSYWITCNVEADVQQLALDRRRLPSSFVVRPRDLNRLLANFQSTLQEITVIASCYEDVAVLAV